MPRYVGNPEDRFSRAVAHLCIFDLVFDSKVICNLKPPGGGGGGTLIFSACIGPDPASTVHPKKISGISSTPKK